ncbi:MAG: response regulator [Burkholderiaceae bacterium]
MINSDNLVTNDPRPEKFREIRLKRRHARLFFLGSRQCLRYSWRMGKQVFIVEDDLAIRENLADALRRHGNQVECFEDRPAAQQAAAQALPDMAIIDVGLVDEPEGGFELCRWLRELAPGLPILILSARDSDIDVVSGLRLGADDYVTKNVSLPHLMARVTALFRRAELNANATPAEQLIERGALRMDTQRFEASWSGERLDLTVTEFWMLHALARIPGHVKDRDALMREANLVVDDHTITSYVKRIRRKLQAIDPQSNAIETVYGLGYRFIDAS